MRFEPNKNDVIDAIEKLRHIERPYGDNEGDAINSSSVYPLLSEDDQRLVDDAEEVAREYVRQPGNNGDQPNRRSITELNNSGYRTSLNQDQYDRSRLVGRIQIGEWDLDLSDPVHQIDD